MLIISVLSTQYQLFMYSIDKAEYFSNNALTPANGITLRLATWPLAKNPSKERNGNCGRSFTFVEVWSRTEHASRIIRLFQPQHDTSVTAFPCSPTLRA